MIEYEIGFNPHARSAIIRYLEFEFDRRYQLNIFE